jgi:glutathione S-transferase
MKLYFNPVSSYSQKVLVALYELEIPFEPIVVQLKNTQARENFLKVSPFGKVPVLVTNKGDTLLESSIIIDYLDEHAFRKLGKQAPSGKRLIPDDPLLARRVRFYDRFFDWYLNEPIGLVYRASRQPVAEQCEAMVTKARSTLETALHMLEEQIGDRTWAAGEQFSMADCAAAPVLAYAQMFHPYPKYKRVVAYAERLLKRPSFARVRSEAAPHVAKLT